MAAKPDLNVIVVVLDSLRQDHVGFYRRLLGLQRVFEGVEPPETPNLDRFASESIVFANAYPSGLPTLPVREELLTGQFTLPYRGWSPLRPDSYTMPELLKGFGYFTGLISDTYHLFKPGMNYAKGFDTWLFIRGQEYDAYRIPPPANRRVEDYVTKGYHANYAGGRSYAELVAQ
ncbi:MAG: sulfatase-like hydrolase/transferase, partial [Thermofilum sp.]|nr:sulfatase-like hydrolase/transferase [Thermofilum sp.]